MSWLVAFLFAVLIVAALIYVGADIARTWRESEDTFKEDS